VTHASTLDTDVCIIGGGPAGLVVARELVARGREVVLLESGAEEPDDGADALNDGDVVGDRYAGLRVTRRRQVGGAMQSWNTLVRGAPGAKWVPLDPVDVDGRWPFDHATLRPYYERAQTLCGLGPYAYDAASWARPETGRAPVQLEGHGLVSRVYQLGARQALLGPTLQRLRESGNATLLTRATVTRLETEAWRVRHAVVASPDGVRRRVRARCFVLAAGAVENARLLLASGDGTGLGDTSGLVGRGFMEHPRDTAITLFPPPGAYGDLGFYDAHVVDGTTILGRLALDADMVRAHDLPNASGTLLPRIRQWGARWLREAGGHGWSRRRAPRLAYDGFTVLLNVEQRPHADNRVVLGRRVDTHGAALPELHWRWHTEEHARLVRLRAVVARGLASLGRVRVRDDASPDPNAHHHAGTTRMHEDPREGVVDAHGRVHAVENLYVAGASVFPTAGFANPTLTIVALALRLADHLAAGER